jgi:hypothetical protein
MNGWLNTMTQTKQLHPARLIGGWLCFYGWVLFIISVYQTTHGLNASWLWLNLLPIAVVLVGLDLIYGGAIQARRAAFLVNAAMIGCGLMILYQALVFAMPLWWLLWRHQFFHSSGFYLLNIVLLGLTQWRLSRHFTGSFWSASPWRGGLVALLIGSVLLLLGLSKAWQPRSFEMTIPANNLVHYLQGSDMQFSPTNISYQSNGNTYQMTATGYAFSANRVSSMQVSWVPITQQTLDILKNIAQRGDVTAEWMLGAVYLASMGSLSDVNEAVKWFQLAANKGNGNAQQALAIAMINGVGVPEDIAQGYQLLKQAAAKGDADAKRLIDKMGVDSVL